MGDGYLFAEPRCAPLVFRGDGMAQPTDPHKSTALLAKRKPCQKHTKSWTIISVVVRGYEGGVGAFVAEISLGNRNIHVRVVETVGC